MQEVDKTKCSLSKSRGKISGGKTFASEGGIARTLSHREADGKLESAYNSLKRLRNTDLEAARDLYYTYAKVRLEQTLVAKTNYAIRFIQQFTIPQVRRARTIIAMR